MPGTLQIPSPCSESWSAMQPSGFDCRFCAACEKNIVDFTQKTDAEILAALQRKNGRICGRFRPDQLNRPLLAARAHRRIGLAAIATGFAAMLSAQQPVMQGQKAPEIILEAEQKPGAVAENPGQDSTYSITGKVVDLETGEALIGVSIRLDSTDHGAITDVNGLFTLHIPAALRSGADLALIFTYTGYWPESVILPPTGIAARTDLGVTGLSAELDFGSHFLTGVIAYSPHPVESRPTFKQRLQRFFHRNR